MSSALLSFSPSSWDMNEYRWQIQLKLVSLSRCSALWAKSKTDFLEFAHLCLTFCCGALDVIALHWMPPGSMYRSYIGSLIMMFLVTSTATAFSYFIAFCVHVVQARTTRSARLAAFLSMFPSCIAKCLTAGLIFYYHLTPLLALYVICVVLDFSINYFVAVWYFLPKAEHNGEFLTHIETVGIDKTTLIKATSLKKSNSKPVKIINAQDEVV